jgi:superfamily II DNA/RNA helicase
VEVAQHCEVIVVDEVDACYSEFPKEMELIMKAALGGFSTTQSIDGDGDGGDGKNKNTSGGSSIVEAIVEIYSLTQDDNEEELEDELEGDEVVDDALLQSINKKIEKKTRTKKPEVVLVGATLDDSLVETAVALHWVQDPVIVAVGKRMQVPPGLQHRYIAVAGETAKVGAMCRQMREDLKSGSQDAAPARVMMFAESEVQARALSDPLRTVLWGEHAISVLLPGGNEPIKALHSFRDNQTTLLLATPAAARGLDLPAVSHVYNLAVPIDAADYLHRAGRAGRIGSPVRGLVTTMVTEGEEEAALLDIAKKLNIELIKEEAMPPPELGGEGDSVGDVEEAKRSLEAVLAFSPDFPREEEEEVESSGEFDE